MDVSPPAQSVKDAAASAGQNEGLAQSVLAGDRRALARAITLVESARPDHRAEALALIDAAGPILPRLRGLERVGERRWDVVLDRGQRIKLPADGALQALERAIALDRAQDMLARDIAVVDLRHAARPVVRLGLEAQNAIRVARGQPELDANGQPIEPEDAKKSDKISKKNG